MKFIYRDFQGVESDNWACVGAKKSGVYSNGQLTAITVSLDFEAVIVAENQYLLSARMAQIQSGILRNGGNVGLLHDDGTASRIFIRSDETIGGVRITQYPFPVPNIKGADYATSLTCRVSFEADYSSIQAIGGGVGGSPPMVLVDYSESLSTMGNGGPRTAIQEYITGEPERFTLADRTKCVATQSGAATLEGPDSAAFQSISEPMFPDLLLSDSVGERRIVTRLENGNYSCAIEWEYKFESPRRIDGSGFTIGNINGAPRR